VSPRPMPEPVPDLLSEERLAAAEAEAARRSFLRMMSHELRTPLNSIIGFADILSSELYGPLGAPQYRDYARIIGVSGERLLNLVNSALEIIRLEAGTADLQMTACTIDSAVDDACQIIAPEAEARGVSIAFDPPWPALLVQADGRALRTIAVNLIQNAVTWSPDGGLVRVGIEIDGPLVRLNVADAGEGADPADIPRLMRPFEQGECALSRRREGAGLGWPLVRLLVKAMGGEFRVETRPGEGLTASVALRRAG
jgi:signal transduction histidine kinase